MSQRNRVRYPLGIDLPLNYGAGCGLTWTDADTFSVAAGEWRSTGDVQNLVLPAAMSKDVANDSSWSAGAGGNAMPSVAQGLGRAVDEEYGVFLIGGSGVATDWGLDTSLTATNLLAAAGATYTAYRRIGWVLTDGSENVREWTQFGDEFVLKVPTDAYSTTTDFDTANVTVTFTGGTVPPSVRATFAVSYIGATVGNLFTLFDAAATAAAPASTTPGTYIVVQGNPDTMQYTGHLSASRTIVARASGGDTNTQLVMVCHSWIDTRGKDA